MKLLYSLFLLLAVAACQGDKHSSPAIAPGAKPSVSASYNYNRLEGTYQGLFDGTDIRIVLRHVTGRHAVGYDPHRGLRRNISGTMQPGSDGFSFTLSEPGDHPYDGVFRFRIDTSNYTLSGIWEPAGNKELSKKDFVLKRVTPDTRNTAYEYVASFGDSLGDFHFYPNGLCKYLYYPEAGGQQEEVKGNWTLQKETYTVSWAPNTVFPAGVSHFKRKNAPEEDYVEALEGEGRVLYNIEIP